jgi:hypothetical protein
MRKFIIVLCLIIISSSLYAQPSLRVKDAVFSFGFVPQQSTMVQYFWFKSDGLDTVRITKIETGCDCTTIPLPRNWIAPGDSFLVGVFWDSQRQIGNAGKYPRIFWEGHDGPTRIYLTGNVFQSLDSLKPVGVSPYKAEFSRVSGKSIDSVGIKISNSLSYPVSLKPVSWITDEYQFHFPDSIPANGSITGYIKVSPAYIDKEFKGSITFEYLVNKQEPQHFTIPIRRRIY